MAAKTWRWLFAAGISSPGTLCLGAEVSPAQDAADDAPCIIEDAIDRSSRRADRLIGDLFDAFNQGAEPLVRALAAMSGDMIGSYLEGARAELAPLDVHAVRFVNDGLAIVTARSLRDGSWHQLTLSLSLDPAIRFIRVDPLRY